MRIVIACALLMSAFHAQAYTRASTASPDTVELAALSHAVDSLVRAFDPAALQVARKEYASALPLLGSKWSAMADRDMGAAMKLSGHSERALSHYRSALDRFRSLQMKAEAAACMERMATLNVLLGRYTAADELLREAMAADWSGNDPVLLARCEYALGYLYAEREESATAAEHFQRSTEIAHRAGAVSQEALAIHGMARVHCLRGDMEEALRTYDRMLALSRSVKDDLLTAQGVAGKAGVLHQVGRADEARRDYEVSLTLLEELNNRPWLVFVHGRLAASALERHDLSDAEEHALAGLTLAKVTGAKRDVADLYEVLFRVNEQAGHSEKAFTYLKEHMDAAVDFARCSGSVSADQITGQLALTEQFYADSLAHTHEHYRRLLDAREEKAENYFRWTWFLGALAFLLTILVVRGRRG